MKVMTWQVSDFFERQTSTGSEPCSLLICRKATKFVLLSVITQEVFQNHSWRVQKVQCRLTRLTHKRGCLNSLYLPICCHKNLDVSSWIKPIKLINKFQHCSLNLVITTSAIIKPSAWQIVKKRNHKILDKGTEPLIPVISQRQLVFH